MRIWDIDPGYLNRGSLLGEHRELHGLISIISNNKKGYSHHPETKRWGGFERALSIRHNQLVKEMEFRGYHHKSPILLNNMKEGWPCLYIDKPSNQYKILMGKYKDKQEGRIPLPRNIYQLWAQHKYSIMSRDIELYKYIGSAIAQQDNNIKDKLEEILINKLREQPSEGGIRNALQHMWGYVSKNSSYNRKEIETLSNSSFLSLLQKEVKNQKTEYIIHSTALVELGVWIDD